MRPRPPAKRPPADGAVAAILAKVRAEAPADRTSVPRAAADSAEDLPEWDEEESEQAPDELRRAEIAAAGAELFGEEDDDDRPILGGADSVAPGALPADGAQGQRKRRRRRRGRSRTQGETTGTFAAGAGGLPTYTVTPAFGEGRPPPSRAPTRMSKRRWRASVTATEIATVTVTVTEIETATVIALKVGHSRTLPPSPMAPLSTIWQDVIWPTRSRFGSTRSTAMVGRSPSARSLKPRNDAAASRAIYNKRNRRSRPPSVPTTRAACPMASAFASAFRRVGSP